MTDFSRNRCPSPATPFYVAVAGMLSLGCTDDYPIAPTFCDDFCHATLRPDCEREPENCVRECELGFRRDACTKPRQVLLACYRQAPDHAFTCNEGSSSVRVHDEFCRNERDDALSCELPNMRECLSLCRPLQQTLDEGARDGTGSDAGGGDVPSVNTSCPLLRDSCETLCWNVLSWGVVSSEQAVNMTGLAIDAADSGLPTGAVELLSEVFEQCGASIKQF